MQFIDTRPNALAEFRKERRRALKGLAATPADAFRAHAEYRRAAAALILGSARSWRAKGNRKTALQCYKIARGHLIIARAWDREVSKYL